MCIKNCKEISPQDYIGKIKMIDHTLEVIINLV